MDACIGRCISDLRSLGGQDGVFDRNTNSLRALNVFSGYAGFEHWWSGQQRSAFSFGIVIGNLDIEPDDALHLTPHLAGALGGDVTTCRER